MSMIREEYNYIDVSEYLDRSNTVLISGFPCDEERSMFFFSQWSDKGKNILQISRVNDGKIFYRYTHNNCVLYENKIDLCIETPILFNKLGMQNESIIIDMSSLDHVLIMVRVPKADS